MLKYIDSSHVSFDSKFASQILLSGNCNNILPYKIFSWCYWMEETHFRKTTIIVIKHNILNKKQWYII